MRINNISPCYNSRPTFKSEYDVDFATAVSRQQIFTLGMMFNNFWMYNPRPTFNQVKYNTYGQYRLRFKDNQDRIVEGILKENNIGFKKVENK